MNKFRDIYRIPSTRLQNWNYGWNAAYFVTICTHDRQNFFGDIVDGKMVLSEIGELANQYWLEIPNHFSFVQLGAFVIMPNHIHGIIIIDKPNDGENENKNRNDNDNANVTANVETRHCLVSTNINTNTKTLDKNDFKIRGKTPYRPLLVRINRW
ncbi:MAG: hypothetical protein WHV28_05860 [Bacteroidota bacterium]